MSLMVKLALSINLLTTEAEGGFNPAGVEGSKCLKRRSTVKVFCKYNNLCEMSKKKESCAQIVIFNNLLSQPLYYIND
jgi:hypothetical protein